MRGFTAGTSSITDSLAAIYRSWAAIGSSMFVRRLRPNGTAAGSAVMCIRMIAAVSASAAGVSLSLTTEGIASIHGGMRIAVGRGAAATVVLHGRVTLVFTPLTSVHGGRVHVWPIYLATVTNHLPCFSCISVSTAIRRIVVLFHGLN